MKRIVLTSIEHFIRHILKAWELTWKRMW